MNVRAFLERLRPLNRPDHGIVTLTLDLSGPNLGSEETRIYLKDLSLEALAPPEERLRTRGLLREVTARIQRFVASEIPPGTQGLYLVAGADLWEALPLKVRLHNFVHLGTAPYLPPLVAALDALPLSFVVRCQERRASLAQVDAGVWTDLDRWEEPGLDPDPERILTGRNPAARNGSSRLHSGTGGGKRERFERSLDSETHRVLGLVARRIASLQAESPAARVYFFGDAERFGEFRAQLSPGLAERTDFLGWSPAAEGLIHQKVEAAIARKSFERLQAEVLEFQDRREQGHLVALGPGDVLDHRTRGRLARVFLDAQEPVPGSHCRSCGMLRAEPPTVCTTCGGETTPTSLTQVIVAHALTHPPVPITFVPHPSEWLAELGGMAALLTQKGISSRR
jgi:hypothetical protein